MTRLKKSLTPQEALAHFGVPGMKWGVRRTASQLARAGSSAKAGLKEHDKEIRDARAKLPAAKREYKEAKKQYRADKKVVGRREAKKALAPVKDQYYKTWSKATDSTTSETINTAIDKHYNKKWRNDQRTFSQLLTDEAFRASMKQSVREIVDKEK